MGEHEKKLIIIPAYNEAKSIGTVIDNIRHHASHVDILVVNDGSLDDTARIAEEKDVFVLNLPYNLGIGGAVQTGYKFACEMDYDIAVQVDGDGQHPAGEISKLIKTVQDDEADIVIGSRYIENNDKHLFTIRRLGKWLLSNTITVLTGLRITDSSSGFRAVNRKVMELFAQRYPRDYPEPETVAFLVREKFRVKEIPVTMNQRDSGESSISFSRGIYYIIKVVLAITIKMFEKRLSQKEP